MELSSRFVGTRLKDYRRKVTWRQTMNFAAALHDTHPIFFDDERPGGVTAPPMFAVAVTWPVIERIGEFVDAEDFPLEMMPTMVHYSEHLAFHRMVRPGDDLSVRGKIAAVLPHRAGTHVVLCLDAVDRRDAPVFTEYMGALMRGVRCTGEGKGGGDLPVVPYAAAEGDPVWEAEISIDPMLPFLYDGCTDIVFPIHTSKGFARGMGLPGNILQGTATLALAAREIIDREAEGDPSRLKILSCRFTGMVLPGSEIQIKLVAKNPREKGMDLHFRVGKQDGDDAIRHGYARLEGG